MAVGKVLLVAAILWGVQRTCASALADLERQEWSARQLKPAWLAVAAVVYLAGLLPSSLFLAQNCCTCSARRPVGSARSAPGTSQLGKIHTRQGDGDRHANGAFLRRDGVGIAVSTATIFYETLTTMAAGAFVAGAILIFTVQEKLAAQAIGDSA